MNSKIEPSKNAAAAGGDMIKYAVSAVLVVAGLFVWFWFSAPERASQLGSWTPQIRGLAVIVGLVLGGLVFLGSSKGRQTREFLSESRFELRKVVWPTRKESIQTTWVVIVVVIVLSLMLGGMDFLIQLGTKWLLGR
ncbi:preprotein translocase subunit SecE [Stenotrophomonas sp. HITSZ_GD]|uniref:preprotein translocase subunit SecE n=1 Tax=Stenotrophomonas sp. HITSZ_GD TaxID=3037248 RepID=UPI00240D3914|nr:preprotein translocase subunit SecE [Stenotrophomonas sp. HITSZ_GD]MDG2527085.1 preprotein translocase subunit SecE [Stenotrophomonas sp. HITSZ_GD]